MKQDAKEIKENTAYAIGVYDGYATGHSRGVSGTSVFVPAEKNLTKKNYKLCDL